MIEKYLMSNCLLLIDEFNDRFKDLDNEELRNFANTEFTEADLVFSIGFPFRRLAQFNMQGKDSDIVIKPKDFIIEVKFIRNTKSDRGIFSNSAPWKNVFEKDFNWLFNQIKMGNKGKRAFVFGWFNVYESFGQIAQFGLSSGTFPEINKDRLVLFPFLHNIGNKTKDIVYLYNLAYETQNIKIPGYADNYANCIFFGQETDKFHITIYW